MTPESSVKQTRKRKQDQQESLPNKRRQPPAFWDNLSTIYLTRQALQELDRRNRAVPQHKRLRTSCRVRLNRDQLSRFARHGGPDLTDLRGVSTIYIPNQADFIQYSEEMPKSRSRGKTDTEKSTSPYDANFSQHLIEHGIFPEGYDGRKQPLPENWAEIIERARRSRDSLSEFTDAKFEEFKNERNATRAEQQVSELLPWVEGKVNRPRDRCKGNHWTNLDPLTDGSLKIPVPDVFYGSPAELLSAPAKDSLHQLIIPQKGLPALPNFTVAIKGPNGSLDVAERQARYDGALCARAMSAGQAPDGNAYAVTSIFHPRVLEIYTSHPVKKPDRTEYFMTQVGVFALGDQRSFTSGAAMYRNLRDWAQEQRLAMIKKINEIFPANPTDSQDSVEDTLTQDTLPETGPVKASNTTPSDPPRRRSSRRKRKRS